MTSPETKTPGGGPTPGRRRWFLAALAIFFAWVAVLGAMAILSGRRPPSQPANARAAP